MSTVKRFSLFHLQMFIVFIPVIAIGFALEHAPRLISVFCGVLQAILALLFAFFAMVGKPKALSRMAVSGLKAQTSRPIFFAGSILSCFLALDLLLYRGRTSEYGWFGYSFL
jgi:uncharacterized membrane protein